MATTNEPSSGGTRASGVQELGQPPLDAPVLADTPLPTPDASPDRTAVIESDPMDIDFKQRSSNGTPDDALFGEQEGFDVDEAMRAPVVEKYLSYLVCDPEFDAIIAEKEYDEASGSVPASAPVDRAPIVHDEAPLVYLDSFDLEVVDEYLSANPHVALSEPEAPQAISDSAPATTLAVAPAAAVPEKEAPEEANIEANDVIQALNAFRQDVEVVLEPILAEIKANAAAPTPDDSEPKSTIAVNYYINI